MSKGQVDLLMYVDRRLDDLAVRLDGEVRAIRESTRLSREAMEYRLAGMNEFRDSLRDQDAKNVTREVLDGITQGLRDQDVQQESRIRRLEERVTADEGGAQAAVRLKSGQRSSIVSAVAIITTALLVVSIAVSVLIATRTH